MLHAGCDQRRRCRSNSPCASRQYHANCRHHSQQARTARRPMLMHACSDSRAACMHSRPAASHLQPISVRSGDFAHLQMMSDCAFLLPGTLQCSSAPLFLAAPCLTPQPLSTQQTRQQSPSRCQHPPAHACRRSPRLCAITRSRALLPPVSQPPQPSGLLPVISRACCCTAACCWLKKPPSQSG